MPTDLRGALCDGYSIVVQKRQNMKQFKFFTTEQEALSYIASLMFTSHLYDADEPYWCRSNGTWVVVVRDTDYLK